MSHDEIKMLYGVIEEIEEEYQAHNAMRKENGKNELALADYLLLRQHALDLVRMENGNCGDLFSIPTFTVDVNK